MSTIPFDQLEAIDTTWNTLTIANDFVFCKAMLNAELCRDVLEAIIGIPIARIEYVRKQEGLDAAPGDKAVRLDVYVRDAQGTVFNVEMQATDTKELPRRTRYYQSLMALDQIRRGERYSTLKDAYVIFICSFDPFNKGRRVYFFENTCRDDHGLKLGDGARTIFLSATAPRGEGPANRLDELLDYVASGTVGGELSARLEAEVASVLNNKKWRLEYMLLEVRDQLNYDRGRAEGEARGREQGLAEGETRMSQLMDALLAQGKTDDARKAASDPAYRESLYTAYGIS